MVHGNPPSPQAHLQALYAPLKDAKIGCPALLSHSYEVIEVAVAGAHNVTISGRDATHPRLHVSASIGQEPRVEIALV